MSGSLDLTSLEKALASLKRAAERSKREPDDLEVRDSVILRFEYTYELCWKMLKRRLELDAANPGAIDQLSFQGLIREGAERGFIAKPEAWFGYREDRNKTSHTYDEETANTVYKTALELVPDAQRLLNALKQAS